MKRKTVTIIVGPQTEAIMHDLLEHMAKLIHSEPSSLTDLVGAAVNESLSTWRKEFLKEGLKTTVNHFN